MEQQKEQQYNPVGWFEIYVDDISRARQFYENVLAVELQDLPDPSNSGIKMSAFPMKEMDAPNGSGSIVQMQGVKAGGNSTIVYFSSADCAVEEGRVEAAGGKIQKPKMAIGQHGFMSLCIDTEGNIFGLHSMK